MFLRRSLASVACANKLHVHDCFSCRYIWGLAPPPPPYQKAGYATDYTGVRWCQMRRSLVGYAWPPRQTVNTSSNSDRVLFYTSGILLFKRIVTRSPGNTPETCIKLSLIRYSFRYVFARSRVDIYIIMTLISEILTCVTYSPPYLSVSLSSVLAMRVKIARYGAIGDFFFFFLTYLQSRS